MDAKCVYKQWLEDPGLDAALKEELISIKDDDTEIEDRFYKELEFGTAGLRGVIGAGTNRMNIYTVSKVTQGLADYINACGVPAEKRSVAIAYDCRHMSPEFADIAASVLNANGVKAYVFEGMRPTPELSFTIRRLGCLSGINITASHNPAEYNGYKVYWSDGAQVTPPHDTGIMACVEKVTNLMSPKTMPKDEAIEKGLYVPLGKEDDNFFIEQILGEIKEPQAVLDAAEKISIVFTPLHGTGITIVPEALRRAGFKNINIVEEQADGDGGFPTVKNPNPEMPEAFVLADKLGHETGADVILATDPDADRIGIHVKDTKGEYHALTGNMIGSLMCEYELSRRAEQGKLPEDGFVVRSIVSSRMVDAIAANYGVKLVEVLTGFKYIGLKILEAEETGKGTFLFGYEESYGFLTGTYARDKDACGAAVVLAELCAYYKTKGLTPWEAVEALYAKYGFYTEKTISVSRPGKAGLEEIANTMKEIRKNPPAAFGSYAVTASSDLNDPEKSGLPKSNVLCFTLDGGWVTIRPSGTEPKIKYYIGVQGEDEAAAAAMLADIEADLNAKYINK